MRLANKVVLVTGASRGIGKGIALEVGQEGAEVALTTHGPLDAAEVDGGVLTRSPHFAPGETCYYPNLRRQDIDGG